MKKLKTKLISATAMLLIAAVMMAGATYAWFTISTNPEISDISANVSTNGNLEIALDSGNLMLPGLSTYHDAGKNTTWGNLVDLRGFFKTAEGSSAITLRPVALNSAAIALASSSAIKSSGTANGSSAFLYPVYGKDGRVAKLVELNKIQASNGINDNFKDFGGVWVYTTSSSVAYDAAREDAENEIYAFEVDYWLRTNATSSSVLLTGNTSSAITSSAALGSSAIGSSAWRDNDKDDATGDQYNSEQGLGSWITDNTVTILITDTSTGKVYYCAYDKKNASKTVSSSIAGNPDVNYYGLTLHDAKWSDDLETYVDSGSIAKIPMTANEGKMLRMFVFQDGATISNADAKLVLTEFVMNVQFTSDQTLIASDVPMTDYERKTANGGN